MEQEAENIEVQSNEVENDNTDAPYAPRVDTSTLPEEVRAPIEARLAHMSSLMRKQETTYEKQAREWRTLAEEQSRKIEELTNGFGQVVDHLSTQSIEAQENDLRNKMQTAFESGDMPAYNKAQTELIQLNVKKELEKNKPKQQKPQPKPEEEADNAISPEEETYVDQWQGEIVNGQQVRPWAFEGHPDYQAAYAELVAVFNSPRYATLPIQQKMAEVDRRMGLQRQSNQTVMGGNLTGNRKGSNIVMTAKQKEIAVKTRFGSKQGAKTDAEYIAAYRKQIDKSQRKG